MTTTTTTTTTTTIELSVLSTDSKIRVSKLETLDTFPGPVSIFSSSFICQLIVNIGANLARCLTKL